MVMVSAICPSYTADTSLAMVLDGQRTAPARALRIGAASSDVR
jgi:hypothetical protein